MQSLNVALSLPRFDTDSPINLELNEWFIQFELSRNRINIKSIKMKLLAVFLCVLFVVFVSSEEMTPGKFGFIHTISISISISILLNHIGHSFYFVSFQTEQICAMPKKDGDGEIRCRGLHHRFYYNKDSGECEQFDYGGCRGNENNFSTKEECEKFCAKKN